MKRPILKVRVGKDVLKALRRRAKQEGTTVSHVARKWLLSAATEELRHE